MPTYQYACTACGEQHEAVQSFTDAPLTECPACGGRLRKVFSAVGVVFKGSGFYKNDSRSTGKGKGSGSGSADGAGGTADSGASATTDSGSGSAGKGDSSTTTKADSGSKKTDSSSSAKPATKSA